MREIWALGFKSINEIRRTDLLTRLTKEHLTYDLDLNPLLVQADPGENCYCKDKHINKVPDTLDEMIWSEIKDKIKQTRNKFSYEIENTSRSVGTRLSHHIYKKFGNNKLEENKAK